MRVPAAAVSGCTALPRPTTSLSTARCDSPCPAHYPAIPATDPADFSPLHHPTRLCSAHASAAPLSVARVMHSLGPPVPCTAMRFPRAQPTTAIPATDPADFPRLSIAHSLAPQMRVPAAAVGGCTHLLGPAPPGTPLAHPPTDADFPRLSISPPPCRCAGCPASPPRPSPATPRYHTSHRPRRFPSPLHHPTRLCSAQMRCQQPLSALAGPSAATHAYACATAAAAAPAKTQPRTNRAAAGHAARVCSPTDTTNTRHRWSDSQPVSPCSSTRSAAKCTCACATAAALRSSKNG